MAKKSMIAKASRPQKFKVREYTRCNRCGRPHSVLKKYGKDLTAIAESLTVDEFIDISNSL